MNGNNNPNIKPEDCTYKIQMGLNDDGTFAFHSNVASLVLGLGMLELGKQGMTVHIARLKQQTKAKIVQPKGGILNFARRK